MSKGAVLHKITSRGKDCKINIERTDKRLVVDKPTSKDSDSVFALKVFGVVVIIIAWAVFLLLTYGLE